MDYENLELKIVGTRSRFLALEPSAEFKNWYKDFLTLVKERGPDWLVNKHQSHGNLGATAAWSGDGAHISLVQWGESAGINLSQEEEALIISKMERVIDETKGRIEGRNRGRIRPIRFGLRTNPLQLVRPPISLKVQSDPIWTMQANSSRRLEASPIGSWSISGENEPPRAIQFMNNSSRAGFAFSTTNYPNRVEPEMRTFQSHFQPL